MSMIEKESTGLILRPLPVTEKLGAAPFSNDVIDDRLARRWSAWKLHGC